MCSGGIYFLRTFISEISFLLFLHRKDNLSGHCILGRNVVLKNSVDIFFVFMEFAMAKEKPEAYFTFWRVNFPFPLPVAHVFIGYVYLSLTFRISSGCF